jgi:hypothetical protein
VSRLLEHSLSSQRHLDNLPAAVIVAYGTLETRVPTPDRESLDVSRYYRRAVTITDPAELAGAVTDKLCELFAEDAREAPTLNARNFKSQW